MRRKSKSFPTMLIHNPGSSNSILLTDGIESTESLNHHRLTGHNSLNCLTDFLLCIDDVGLRNMANGNEARYGGDKLKGYSVIPR